MFEVFNCNTGRVVKRCRDVKEAHRKAQDYESAYEWVDGSKFDYRPLDEATTQELKRRQLNKRKRSGKVMKAWA